MLSAPIRNFNSLGSPSTSIIYSALKEICTKDISDQYLNDDDLALGLYLRNLDQIQKGLLEKFSESNDISQETASTSLESTSEEKNLTTASTQNPMVEAVKKTFEILQNVRAGNPKIQLDQIFYNQKGDELDCIMFRPNRDFYAGMTILKGSTLKFTGTGYLYYISGAIYEGEFKEG